MRSFSVSLRRSIRLRVLSVAAGALATVVSMATPSDAGTVTFGSNGNEFSMEFVTIGNPGNSANTTVSSTAGSVGYTYDIGKFEVSQDMIAKFNASQSLQITQDGRFETSPATSVSWNEAARFVNWLNTSTGNQEAYKFTNNGVNDDIDLWTALDTLDYDAANPYRSKRAKYVLPSYNEWYKAAYYDPINSQYYLYPTGSDTAPTAVASGTDAGTAVYLMSYLQYPADVDQAGGLSPYGVMGLGGNAYEWDESSDDLANSRGDSFRGLNGGSWYSASASDLSWSRYNDYPSNGFSPNVGFRVASLSSDAAVPEPSMMVIGTLLGLGGLIGKRRIKR